MWHKAFWVLEKQNSMELLMSMPFLSYIQSQTFRCVHGKLKVLVPHYCDFDNSSELRLCTTYINTMSLTWSIPWHLNQKNQYAIKQNLTQIGFHLLIKFRLPRTLLLLHFIYSLPLECQFCFTQWYTFHKIFGEEKIYALIEYFFLIPLMNSKHQVEYNHSLNLG